MSHPGATGEAEIATAGAGYRTIDCQRRIDGSDADIGRGNGGCRGYRCNSRCEIFKSDSGGTEDSEIVLAVSFKAAGLPCCWLGECESQYFGSSRTKENAVCGEINFSIDTGRGDVRSFNSQIPADSQRCAQLHAANAVIVTIRNQGKIGDVTGSKVGESDILVRHYEQRLQSGCDGCRTSYASTECSRACRVDR